MTLELVFDRSFSKTLHTRVEDCLSEISWAAVKLDSESEDERDEATAAYVRFFCAAAFGLAPPLKRLVQRIKHNFASYYLRRRAGVEYVIKCHHRALDGLSLNDVEGFSSVLPLTPVGADNYLLGNKGPGEFDANDVVAFEQRQKVRDVLTAGVVHFPSIKKILYGVTDLQAEAFGLIRDHINHLSTLMTEIEVDGKNNINPIVPIEGDVPPRIFCPLSGRGLGERYIPNAGFVCDGVDKSGSRKFVLDFAEYAAASAERQQQMLKTARAMVRWRQDPFGIC